MYLPALHREHHGCLVLDSSHLLARALIALARAWREDPEGVGAQFADIADRDDQAHAEAHLDGAGMGEHLRDQLIDQLLAEAGGAQFELRQTRDRHAAHQARRIAEEARRMADTLDENANWITVEVEKAEAERTARYEAELRYLRALLGAAELPVATGELTATCRHCACWARHTGGVRCHLGCGTHASAVADRPEARPPAHTG